MLYSKFDKGYNVYTVDVTHKGIRTIIKQVTNVYDKEGSIHLGTPSMTGDY